MPGPQREVVPIKLDPYFDAKFMALWGDGKSEVNTYKLSDRASTGTATMTFRIEQFSNSARGRAGGKHGPGDAYPVMAMHLVKTIGDEHRMLSCFLSMASVNRRAGATPTKVVFSAQNSTDHVYGQVLFNSKRLEFINHSYVDSDVDERGELGYLEEAFAEDTLFHWARAMARPFAGNNGDYLYLSSVEDARLKHRPLTYERQALLKEKGSNTIQVPAGAFEVETLRFKRKNGSWRAFSVEKAFPRRIVKWSTSEGESAELLTTERR